jgi:MoaA/NifB/PqqE/SkfB family radical SAM enzyme
MPPTPLKSSLRGLRAWWEHQVLFEPKDWIQVEVTTRCNAACIYCPRTVYRDSWRNRSLPLALYERLVPAFGKTGLVYLQGWGEPLLHPDLPAMVAMAKAAGSRVGTTTNGVLLDASLARRLVESELDVITFSLAGTTAASNDRIRAGTRMEIVLEKIALLEAVKRQCASSTPAVHIAYMLLASGMTEIQRLPGLLAHSHAAQVVVSVLDFEPCRSLAGEVVHLDTQARRAEVETVFTELRAAGRTVGLEIHTPRGEPIENRDSCSENIQRALVVSAAGEVSPCVLTNLPVAPGHHCADGQNRPNRRLIFGNIRRSLLPVIWRNSEYVGWRAAHAAGEVAAPCAGCSKRLR